MSGPIIDPSEIIVDKSGTIKEDTLHANPWVRFLARFFDYAWFFLSLLAIKSLIHSHLTLGRFESFIPVEFFGWIPVEAIFLSIWGTTPGKFFLKVKLKQGRRIKLPFQSALKRSFNVWFRGLGMMIPVVNGFCLIIAYHRLKVMQTTTWDREDHILVSHAPIGKWRVGVAAALPAIVFLFYFNTMNLLWL